MTSSIQSRISFPANIANSDNLKPFESSLAGLFFHLGGVRDNLDKRVRNLANVILKDWDLSKDEMTRVFIACVSELPDKSSVYACLLGLVSAARSDIAQILLEQVKQEFDSCIGTGQWRKLKLILRFIGELVRIHVVEEAELFAIYKCLLDAILSTSSTKYDRKDQFCYLLLTSLAWSGSALVHHHKADIESILGQVNSYLSSARLDRENALSYSCKILSSQVPEINQDDWIKLIFNQISKHGLMKDFNSELFLRFDALFAEDLEQSSPVLFGPIVFPLADQIKFSSFKCNFEIFNQSILSTRGRMEAALPETVSFDRMVLYDLLDDMLAFFSHNHNEFVKYYVQFIDHVPDSSKNSFNIHQALTEVLMNNLLQLPKSEFCAAYYATVIFDLCNTFKRDYPPILGKVFYTLIESIHLFDPECRVRLARWFSHHLSNFDYRWNWKAWVEIISEIKDEYDVKVIFLQEVLENCVRLSYFERVSSAFGSDAEVMKYMPPQPEPSFHYQKFASTELSPENLADSEERQAADDFLHKLRLKSYEEFDLALEELRELGEKRGYGQCSGEKNGFDFVRKIALECILVYGSKSLSHLSKAYERSLPILTSINKTDEGQEKTLDVIFGFWYKNKIFLEQAILKSAEYGFISYTNIIQWMFTSKSVEFHRAFIWNIIFGLMDSLIERIEALKAAPQSDSMQTDMGEEDVDDDSLQSAQVLESVKSSQKRVLISILEAGNKFITDNPKHPQMNTVKQLVFCVCRHYSATVAENMITLETVLAPLDSAFINVECLIVWHFRGNTSRITRLSGDFNALSLPQQQTLHDHQMKVEKNTQITDSAAATTIIVFGASGDLAKKKTYPAIFGLLKNGYLPKFTSITGFARSKIEINEFRSRVTEKIKLKNENERLLLDSFKSGLSYHSGNYDREESFQSLLSHIESMENKLYLQGARSPAHRIFYLALPPTQFLDVCKNVRKFLYHANDGAVHRVVVEKPFGKDLETSNILSSELRALLPEKDIFRIDHYLGKEMVKNLLVLKFANIFFSGIWNRKYISNVQITFKEPFGTEGRGGYFDQYGIIRDVIQNHLLQVMSIVAMDNPVSLGAEDIRDEKVKVLKCIKPVPLDKVILGQYVRSLDGQKPSYIDDETVPNESNTPTYAALVLYVNNERWADVPFILKAGKALNEQKAEIRIQFQDVPGSIFPGISRNELVIRVQPNEAVYMKLMNKKPGLEMETTISELDLTYSLRYGDSPIPDAYEALILDVLKGDQSNFVRDDELEAAWKIFTPLLHRIDGEKIVPEKYAYGSRGPDVTEFMSRHGFVRHRQEYIWSPIGSNKL